VPPDPLHHLGITPAADLVARVSTHDLTRSGHKSKTFPHASGRMLGEKHVHRRLGLFADPGNRRGLGRMAVELSSSVNNSRNLRGTDARQLEGPTTRL
jgi:hypothetical protein